MADNASGWTQVLDEGSQTYYYHNTLTYETTWDAPEGFSDDTEDINRDGAADPDYDQVEEAAESDWQQIYDEPSDKYYFYNATTGETSWEDPATSADTGDVGHDEEPLDVSIPSPWSEIMDESSGLPYFYNSETGECLWERPAEMDNPVASTKGPKVSRDDWIEHWSEDYGLFYYENKDTHECLWECPYDKEEVEQSASSEMKNADGIEHISLLDAMELDFSIDAPLADISYIPPPEEFLNLIGKKFKSSNSRSTANNTSSDDTDISRDGDSDGSTPLLSTCKQITDQITFHKTPQEVSDIMLQLDIAALDSIPSLQYLHSKVRPFDIEIYAENCFNYDRKATATMSTLAADQLTRMLVYQPDPLKKSLCLLPAALSAEAVHCFEIILAFMTDGPSGPSSISAAITTHGPSASSAALTPSNKASLAATSSPLPLRANTGPSRRVDHAALLVQRLMQAPAELHDEVYCQLCKQTRRNPSDASSEFGWQLLLICLSCVPPSRKLFPFFVNYLLNAVMTPPDSRDAPSSAEELKRNAASKHFIYRAIKMCFKVTAMRHLRQEVPSYIEIQSMLLNESIFIAVELTGNSNNNMDTYRRTVSSHKVDSFTRMKDLKNDVCSHYGLLPEHWDMFSLYLKPPHAYFPETPSKAKSVSLSPTKVSRTSSTATSSYKNGGQGTDELKVAHPDWLVVDTLSVWLRIYGNSLNLDKAAAASTSLTTVGFVLLFKAQYIFPFEDSADPAAMHLLYQQAVCDVTNGVLPHTIQDATVLAALQLHVAVREKRAPREVSFLSPSSREDASASGAGSSPGGEMEKLRLDSHGVDALHVLQSGMAGSDFVCRRFLCVTGGGGTDPAGKRNRVGSMGSSPHVTQEELVGSIMESFTKMYVVLEDSAMTEIDEEEKQATPHAATHTDLQLQREIQRTQHLYLEYVRGWKFYGATFFLVHGEGGDIALAMESRVPTPASSSSSSSFSSSSASLPDEDEGSTNGGAADDKEVALSVILSVSPRYLLLIDPASHTHIAEFDYQEIVSWSHSFDSFALVVGGRGRGQGQGQGQGQGHSSGDSRPTGKAAVQVQSKYFFKTPNGKAIDDLLSLYQKKLRPGNS